MTSKFKTPTQVYKPKDFFMECDKIYSKTRKVIENGRNAYYDENGNRYQINGCDQTISVN